MISYWIKGVASVLLKGVLTMAAALLSLNEYVNAV